MKKKYLILQLTILFAIFLPSFLYSSPLIQKGEPINTKADYLFYDTENETLKASGNVTISTSGTIIKGDVVFFDKKNKFLNIKGNAVLQSESQVLSGDSVYLNYETKTGLIKEGKIFIKEVNFYISGKEIEKLSEKTYLAKDASLTACDNPKKDWEFKAGKIKATLDGYGSAYNVSFRTMDRPLLYTPFLFFPIKTKRESGLLVPQIEYSDKFGLQYHQPLYIVLSDQADATLYYQYMEKRSDKPGIEFRIKPTADSFTQIFYDMINNDKYQHGPLEEDELDSTDRYWFRMKSDFNVLADFKANLDIDIVSDPYYLRDFDDGYMGYDFTEEKFYENFNRNIEPEDDTTRTNRFFLSKNFDSGSLETEFLWIDDLIIKENDSPNTTVQSLPRISFRKSRSRFLKTPIQTAFDTEYTYFHRVDGEKGHRTNITPKVYLPFSVSNYINIEPSAYVHETFWYTEKEEDGKKKERDSFRQLYGFDLKTSSSVFKVFNIHGDKIDKIKHTITPQLNYSYVQDKNQSDLPDFNEFDRIVRKKEVEFALIQTLTSKERIPSNNKDEEPKYNYREMMRFELSQIYDLIENKKNDESDGEYEAKPFKDLEAYLRFAPIEYFNIEFDSKWSHYDHLFSEKNIRVTGLTEKGSKLSVEHRYTHDESESFRFSGELVLSEIIKLHGMYEETLKEDKIEKDEYERELGLEYTSQCWKADLVYNETEDEKKVTLLIELSNLGGFHQSISNN